jgi:CarD family transcriptional regulator
MPDEEDIWIIDNVERKNAYRAIISSGNPRDIIKVIKTLQRVQMEKESNGKRLSTSDECLLNDAQRILHDEFALVLNIQPEQVHPFILKELDDIEEN